jgi:hypothetical protein
VLRQLPLVRSLYTISVWLGDGSGQTDHRWDVISFEFRPKKPSATEPQPDDVGYLDWPANWRLL